MKSYNVKLVYEVPVEAKSYDEAEDIALNVVNEMLIVPTEITVDKVESAEEKEFKKAMYTCLLDHSDCFKCPYSKRHECSDLRDKIYNTIMTVSSFIDLKDIDKIKEITLSDD